MVEFVGKRTQFAADNNCGRCVPCREGTELLRDLYDEAFVENRTTGFEDVRESVQAFPPERVEEVTGVPHMKIVAAAETIAEAETCVFGWTLGLTEHSHGTERGIAMANLAAITGTLGKPGAGVSPFRGQNNVQGGGDMGPLPDSARGARSYGGITAVPTRLYLSGRWSRCDRVATSGPR